MIKKLERKNPFGRVHIIGNNNNSPYYELLNYAERNHYCLNYQNYLLLKLQIMNKENGYDTALAILL